MPRAQTPPTTSGGRSRVSPLTPKHPSNRDKTPVDVLELASSDAPDSPSLSPHKPVKRRSGSTTKRKRKPKPKEEPSEVIEISSDDDDAPPRRSAPPDLWVQVEKLKAENERHQKNYNQLLKELTRSRLELKEAKAQASEHKPVDGRLILDLSQLEDGLSCEICTNRMYSPYILPDCGHTFCLSCLRDWFGTTHAHFVQAHPRWNINVMETDIARLQTLIRPEYLYHPHIYNFLQQSQPTQPEYACPKCRKRAFRRPVEDYALKSLVRGISAANKVEKGGIPDDKPLVERRQGHLVVVDPWEGYFPKGSL